MKKIILFILALFILLLPTMAKDYWNKTSGPYGGRIMSIIGLGGDSLTTATANAVYLSTNNGSNWKQYGLDNKTIYDLTLQSDGRLYASCTGGVWVSTDNGGNWSIIPGGIISGANYKITRRGNNGQLLTIAHSSHQYNKLYKKDSISSGWVMIGTPNQLNLTIEVNPSNGTFFLGSFGEGIYRSTNGGQSFDTHRLDTNTVNSVYIDGSGNVYAGTKDNGIYKSSDNGSNWTNICSTIRNVKAMLVVGDTIYAGSEQEGLFRSVNAGLSWQSFNNGMVNKSIYVLNNFSGKIFCGSNGAGIYKLYGNSSWTDVSKGIAELPVNDFMKLSETTVLVATNGKGIFKTTDKGASWVEMSIGLNSGFTYKLDKAPNGVLYAFSSYGDFYYSSDSGNSWVQTVQPSEFIGFGAIGVNPVNGDILLCDRTNRIKISTNNGNSWTLTGPENAIVKDFIFARNGNVIAATYNLGILYSTDNGANWTTASAGENEFFSLAVDSAGLMYAGNYRGNLYRSANNGVNWSSFRSFPSVIEVLSCNGNGALFVGTRSNGFYLSTDSGQSFANVVSGLRYANINALCADDTLTVWLGSSDGIYLSTDIPIILDKVELLSPANKAEKQLLNPSIKWKAVENADEYRYIVSKDSLFSEIVEDKLVRAVNSQIQKTLNSGSVYYWKVQGKKEIYSSPWSDVWSFSTSLRTPSLLSPLPGEIGPSETALFKWSNVEEAAGYRIRVSRDSNFVAIEHDLPVWTNSHKIEGLEPNTKYFWQVRAEKGAMKSEWSAYWEFSTGAEVPIPFLPMDNSVYQEIKINLVWKSTKNGESYMVEFSDNPSFSSSNIIFSDSLLKDTSVTVNGNYNRTYYWRVRAKSGGIISKWSEKMTFSTGKQPPVLISPDSSSNNNPPAVILEWSELKQFDNYEVLVSDDYSFKNTVFRTVTFKNSCISHKLEFSKIYYWKARALSAGDSTLWSNVWSFVIGKKPPTATFPTPNLKELSVPVEFKWEKYGNNTRYELQISKSSDFANIIRYIQDVNDLSCIIGELDICEEYWWRIRAISTGEVTLWSEPKNFSTGLNPPHLISPENNSSNIPPANIQLCWEPVIGAVRYSVQVSKTIDFEELCYDRDSIYSTHLTLDSLTANTKFFWRLKAHGLECNSRLTEPNWFFTQSVSGINTNSNEELAVRISPNPADNELKYKIWIDKPMKAEFSIISINGKSLVKWEENYESAGIYEHCRPVDALPSAIYFLIVRSSEINIAVEFMLLK